MLIQYIDVGHSANTYNSNMEKDLYIMWTKYYESLI